jgi:predicted N-acetyltransferase YhbS
MALVAAARVRVVPLAEADLEAVASLVTRAFYTHPMMGTDRTSVASLPREAGPGAELLIAEVDGRMVGSAMIHPGGTAREDPRGAPAYEPPPFALYFGMAAVEPDLMRTGIGRALLAEAERLARARGFSHVALNTLVEFDLVDYYARLGYVPVAHEDFEAGHWGVTAPHRLVHMEKQL